MPDKYAILWFMEPWITVLLFIELAQLGLLVWVGLSKKNDNLAQDEILSKVKLLLLRERLGEESRHDS